MNIFDCLELLWAVTFIVVIYMWVKNKRNV